MRDDIAHMMSWEQVLESNSEALLAQSCFDLDRKVHLTRCSLFYVLRPYAGTCLLAKR